MGCANHHVHHADLIFNLPDHYAEFTRVRSHPHQHTSGRTHRIRRVEFHACRRSTHGNRLIAGNYSKRFGSSWRLP
jgi:hypothetical protein